MKYILSGIPLIHKINQFSDNPKILHIEYISILLYLRLNVVKCGLTIDSVPHYYICIYSDVQIKSAKASCTLYSSSTAQKLGNTRCTLYSRHTGQTARFITISRLIKIKIPLLKMYVHDPFKI